MLYNVTFTDVDVLREITVEADSPELADYIAQASYGRTGYEWDGQVSPAPEPPPTLLDKDNVDHPNYAQFAGVVLPEEPAPTPVEEPPVEDA